MHKKLLWVCIVIVVTWNCNAMQEIIPVPFNCMGKPIGHKVINYEDCREYIVCHETIAYKLSCDVGTKFIYEQQSCVPGTCDATPIPTTKPPPTQPPPFYNCGQYTYGYKIADQSNCQGYIVCLGTKYEVGYCAEGSKFDQNSQTCIAGQCKSPKCQGHYMNYKVADPADCTKYILCLGTTSQAGQCPLGTRFNELLQDCVPGKCATTAASCLDKPNGTIIPDLEHCRFFKQCVNGEERQRFCELGMWFDRDKYVCNFPRYVKNCPAAKD